MVNSLMAKLVYTVAACLVVAAPYTQAQVTCNTVIADLTPCLSYLQNGGPVSYACCNGVQSLNAAASTTNDRQTACRCFKMLANNVPGVAQYNARTLPRKCGVYVGYPISPSVDCSRVQ